MNKFNVMGVLKYSSAITLLFFLFATSVDARENPTKSGGSSLPSKAAGCAPGTIRTEIDFNNVRAGIRTNGILWNDPQGQSNPWYEVPKGGGVHAIFSGSLWMG